MRILFDTSAMYKRYENEPGRARVLSLAEQATEVCVAAHCKLELMSALNRQRHDAVLEQLDYLRIMQVVRSEFAEFTVLPLDERVERLAIAAMERVRLRAMDAWHIGAAQSAQVELFVTADRRQAIAAQAAGLVTELVEADK